MSSPDFQKLQSAWESLGRDDPLWAVVSHDDKAAGKWDAAEFLRTGETDVSRFHELLRARAGAPPKFREVLDFGCGVGRLSLAWSRRADRVVGVDISQPMLERGRDLARGNPNVELLLNSRPDLELFADNRFDLVTSHVCLQHMPWTLAAEYVREFARVCAPAGVIAFQLPSRWLAGGWLPRFRRRLVDSLPFGGAKWYRRWRHGREQVFEMHFTPQTEVLQVAAAAGLQLLHLEPDASAGPGTEGFIYIFRKGRA